MKRKERKQDVSTTALHRRLRRCARVRQWLIGERVKNLLTKDVDGQNTQRKDAFHTQAKNRS
jgi:hypothetical protein